MSDESIPRPASTTGAGRAGQGEAREALRSASLAALPPWYNPWLHLAIPSLFGLAIIAACLALLEPLSPWQLVAVPMTCVISNINEWRTHRYMLHRKSRLAPVLYQRHTPMHHRVYVTHDMAMRSPREFGMVLIPAYGIMLIFAAVSIPAAAIWLLGWHNVALLFVATSMAYVLGYEWLHLSYHLPADSVVGRSRLIRSLKHHHAVHHDPRLMSRYNFNVTVPLWDWVRGTIAPRR